MNSESPSCAGKEIKGAMHIFSTDLLQGCSYFSFQAQKVDTEEEIRFFNTACIVFATSIIESKINEWISISSTIAETEVPEEFWKTLDSIKKDLSIQEKWNLIASLNGGTMWDGSKEPFQSFNLITALRNELVHYKGHFLGKDEVPIKKIKDLMAKFKIKSSATFTEDDVSCWISDLLNEPKVSEWVAKRINDFHVQVIPLLGIH